MKKNDNLSNEQNQPDTSAARVTVQQSVRPIEFRVWDKINKSMHPKYGVIAEIKWDEGNEPCFVGIYEWVQVNEYGDGDWDGFSRNKGEFELLQFTGIVDKNGKKIYEGDIVKMHQFLFDGAEVEKEHIGIVRYSNFLAAFIFAEIKGEFYQGYTGYDEGEGASPICEFYGLHDESFEVVGNIYEN